MDMMRRIALFLASLAMVFWLQVTATAPALVAGASIADQDARLAERISKRADEEEEGTSRNQSPTDRSADSNRRSDPEAVQRELIRQMFHLDAATVGGWDGADVQNNYMMEFYNEVADNDTGILRPSTAGKQRVLTENVQSLPVRGAIPGVGGRWRLTFNSSVLPSESDQIVYATLAVHSRHCQPGWRTSPAGRALKATGSARTNFSVYTAITKDTALANLHVITHRVKMRGKCWHVFDQTHSVQEWQRRKRRGMRHFVLEHKGNLGQRWSANAFLRLQDSTDDVDPGNRPVLIIYSGKVVRPPASVSRQRSRRDTDGRSRREALLDQLQNGGGPGRSANGDPIRGIHHSECARRELTIDFSQSGWHRWIISPRQYRAYRCAGTCIFPINKNIRSTLHARLEASVVYQNELKGIKDELPGSGACCVPTGHTPLSLLFRTRAGGQLLHIANKMVADRCGCR